MRAHQRATPPRAVRGPLASLRRLDRLMMRRAHGIDSPGLDRVLVRITTAANYWRLWLAIAALLALLGGRRGRAAAGRGVLALMIAAITTNGPVKLLARRRRPAPSVRPALIRMPRSPSFPSGHSAAAFAFATAAAGELPELAPVLGPLAVAVGYSRVHTGVHYPSDVAAGAAIGVGSAVLSRRLGRHSRNGAGPPPDADWTAPAG
jgi:membrane-associated phospholipid phosphatase